MRVAVVSDIHGSHHALQSVLEDLRRSSPDLVLHGGDLVVNGPRPREVASTIRELGWAGVVGNTDEMLWMLDELPRQQARMPGLEQLLRVMYEHTAPAALEQLSDEDMHWLRSLPRQVKEGDIALTHATPNDLWRAPSPRDDDTTLQEAYASLAARIVVYGHIHRPFVRRLDDMTVANSGSVGLTWDGDPRASYLLIDDHRLEIRRVEYPIEREVGDLVTAGHPYASWLAEMRREGRYVAPDPSLG